MHDKINVRGDCLISFVHFGNLNGVHQSVFDIDCGVVINEKHKMVLCQLLIKQCDICRDFLRFYSLDTIKSMLIDKDYVCITKPRTSSFD